jgi:hypothetical protein
MEIKLFRRLVIFLFFFLVLDSLYSQEPVYIMQTGEGARIIQRISWPGDANASQYGLTVERQEKNGYVEVHKEQTRRNSADVSLGPGIYRYRVSYYNLLNQVEYVSNWAAITIITAVQPAITGHYPKAFYIHEDPSFEISLSGENLVKGAEVFLQLEPSEGEKEGKIILPRSYVPNSSGSHATAAFAPEDLIQGKARLFVRNPGGLVTDIPFTIAEFKPYDLNLSAGYAPLVPLYGFLFDLYDAPFNPLGAQIRAGYFPIKHLWGFIGFEGSFAWNYLKTTGNSADISLHSMAISANVVYKKTLPNKHFAILARAGLGITSIIQFTFDYGVTQSTPLNTWIPMVDGGLSFQWYVRKPFHLNFGADYVHLFSRDTPFPGFLRPYVEAGWQF